MSEANLAKALEDVKAPCDEFRCRRRHDCAVQEMACDSFVVWVRSGRVAPTPDEPNGFKFTEVFKDAN